MQLPRRETDPLGPTIFQGVSFALRWPESFLHNQGTPAAVLLFRLMFFEGSCWPSGVKWSSFGIGF